MDEKAKKTYERYMSIESHLRELLNSDPEEAIEEAKNLQPENDSSNEYFNIKQIKALFFTEVGIALGRKDIIKDGFELYEWCYYKRPTAMMAYNVANALAGIVGSPPCDETWLDHMEQTRGERAKIRQYFWKGIEDKKSDYSLEGYSSKSLILTNIGNQFISSYRYSDAYDAWFRALRLDPRNGVAAYCIAQDLEKFCHFKIGSESTLEQVKYFAKIIRDNSDRLIYYNNKKNAIEILKFAQRWPEPSKDYSKKIISSNKFIEWVRQERLALDLMFDVTSSNVASLDSLILPQIKSSLMKGQPLIFSMFNMIKSDFILARDLTWRAFSIENWSDTKNFASTSDGAIYGVDISALILAHRFVLDILDKIAVAVNNYFDLEERVEGISFGNLWRNAHKKKKADKGAERPLKEKIEKLIRSGVRALYGLVELSGDYHANEGILNFHKEIRNASTHRFVILHEYMEIEKDECFSEIKRYEYDKFQEESIQALRIARSAIQLLFLAIRQNEDLKMRESDDYTLDIAIPDFERY